MSVLHQKSSANIDTRDEFQYYIRNMSAFFKKYIVCVVLVFAATVTLATSVSAQDDVPPSERWSCMQTVACFNSAGQCSDDDLYRMRIRTQDGARAIPSSETYIIECFTIGTETLCTTGNSSLDMTVYKKDNVAELARRVGYQHTAQTLPDGRTPVGNPVTSSSEGVVGPYEWRSVTSQLVPKRFFVLNFFRNTLPGSTATQQQGTLSFEAASTGCSSTLQALPPPPPDPAVPDTAISTDPYGRLFDAQSLEPIMGAQVELLLKRDNGQFTRFTLSDVHGAGTFTNPQLTSLDGKYSFVVPDGTYRLNVSVAGYTFPVENTSSVSAQVKKIYSDIYPSDTGIDIVQKGAIVHRDIPLQLNSAAVAQNNQPEMLEFYHELNKEKNTLFLEGKVSHPYAIVRVWSQIPGSDGQMVRNRVVATVETDRYAKFKTTINQANFEVNEVVGSSDIEKIDYTTLTRKSILENIFAKLFPAVFAQGSKSIGVFEFEPIPNYIDGVAYNDARKPMPHSSVGVYLTFSDKPVYMTATDANGRFNIPSAYLPSLPYELRYSDTNTAATVGNVISKKPTQESDIPSLIPDSIGDESIVATAPKTFLALNAQHLEDKDINVNKYSNQIELLDPVAAVQAERPEIKLEDGPNLLIVLVVVIGVLSSLGFFLYFAKKHRS